MIQNCKICQKEFNTYPSLTKKGKGKYCSHICQGIAESKKVKCICGECSKEFFVHRRTAIKGFGKYCSRKCSDKGRTGKPNKKRGGFYPQHRGINNGMWKGDDASYVTFHTWLYREKGRASNHKCSFKSKDCLGRIEWANISREYKRDLDDWMPLCTKHHRQFDKGFNSIIEKWPDYKNV